MPYILLLSSAGSFFFHDLWRLFDEVVWTDGWENDMNLGSVCE